MNINKINNSLIKEDKKYLVKILFLLVIFLNFIYNWLCLDLGASFCYKRIIKNPSPLTVIVYYIGIKFSQIIAISLLLLLEHYNKSIIYKDRRFIYILLIFFTLYSILEWFYFKKIIFMKIIDEYKTHLVSEFGCVSFQMGEISIEYFHPFDEIRKSIIEELNSINYLHKITYKNMFKISLRRLFYEYEDIFNKIKEESILIKLFKLKVKEDKDVIKGKTKLVIDESVKLEENNLKEDFLKEWKNIISPLGK